MMNNQPSRLLNSVSKVISNFFNPLTSLLIFFIYYSSKNYGFEEAIRRFLPILIITIIPISGWIFWNVKTGKYSNMDVSNRNQRKSLYIFIGISTAVYLLYDYFTKGKLDLVMFFLLVLLLVMQLSNYFIKSSMHTAFNFFVAALFFRENEILGLLWIGISVLVGFTRIILKRHTPKEVIMGATLAILVSFIYLYTSIQIQH